MLLKNIFILRPGETITNELEKNNKNYRIFLKKAEKNCKKNYKKLNINFGYINSIKFIRICTYFFIKQTSNKILKRIKIPIFFTK
jgi:hypothetical protein